jgi:hypothetical protein
MLNAVILSADMVNSSQKREMKKSNWENGRQKANWYSVNRHEVI